MTGHIWDNEGHLRKVILAELLEAQSGLSSWVAPFKNDNVKVRTAGGLDVCSIAEIGPFHAGVFDVGGHKRLDCRRFSDIVAFARKLAGQPAEDETPPPTYESIDLGDLAMRPLSQLQRELAGAMAQIESLAGQLTVETERVRIVRGERDTCAERIEELERWIEDLRNKHGKLNQEHEALQGRHQKLETQAQCLKDMVQDRGVRLEQQTREIHAQVDEILDLREQACRWYHADGTYTEVPDPEVVIERRKSAASKLAEQEKDIENYRTHKERLEQRVRDLETDLQAERDSFRSALLRLERLLQGAGL